MAPDSKFKFVFNSGGWGVSRMKGLNPRTTVIKKLRKGEHQDKWGGIDWLKHDWLIKIGMGGVGPVCRRGIKYREKRKCWGGEGGGGRVYIGIHYITVPALMELTGLKNVWTI